MASAWVTALLLLLLHSSGAAGAADMPQHCEVGVVGAGFSGIYFAWRLGVDARKVDPAEICIFEVNSRIGGRIYTVRDYKVNGLEMPVDVGGYRVREMDKLPYDLITRRLKLPVSCYDFECENSCGGVDTTCYNVVGAYGHSQFSLTMETMLGQLKSLGTKVFFGAEVTDVRAPAREGRRWGRKSADLIVQRGGETYRVNSRTVLLNVPNTALKEFPEDGLLGAGGGATETFRECLDGNIVVPATKVYAVYDDAWWYSVLGKMQGDFANHSEALPLAGRYHDGPVRCVVGKGRDGGDVYSDTPVPFGKCSGALLVHYTLFTNNTWEGYQLHPNATALSIFAPGDDAGLLDRTHRVLMDFHAGELLARGVDPSSLATPKAILIGNYNAKNKFAALSISATCNKDPEKLKALRKPHPQHRVYVANHDIGSYDNRGWATSGLVVAEKVLQAELHVPYPRWLDRSFYRNQVRKTP